MIAGGKISLHAYKPNAHSRAANGSRCLKNRDSRLPSAAIRNANGAYQRLIGFAARGAVAVDRPKLGSVSSRRAVLTVSAVHAVPTVFPVLGWFAAASSEQRAKHRNETRTKQTAHQASPIAETILTEPKARSITLWEAS